MNNLVLRDYQQDIYDKIRIEFRKGHKGVCAVLPCRSGKSYLFAKISEDACKKKSHVLILAHRHSLINQHKELFEELSLNNEYIRIESVFTEVNHLGENGPVDLIIIDEAHLSGATSYKKVCEYYNCLRILLTGSPARLDGKPLDLADSMVVGISANELIKRGQISDYDYYAPNINLDLSNVTKTCGDYNNKELEQAVNKPTIYGDIIKYYKELGQGRQALAYCINIQHSKDICDLFNNNGISARHIDSKTPEKEREQVMQDFKDNKFTILCNCNLISEGITLPNASVGLLLRPTLSLPLFIQQSCRVLTPIEGKKAIIIDYVNNVQKHGLPTQDRDWSLKEKVKEYDNENEDGTFKLRICQNCFGTYEAKEKICPYCGAEYERTEFEIQNIKNIELKKIEAAREEKKRQYLSSVAEKVKNYTSPKECKTWTEMTEYAKKMGFKPGYAYIMAKQNGLFIPRREK